MKGGEILARVLVVMTMAAVVTFGLTRGLFVAAAADAYGYVSQADLWATGDLVVHQPYAQGMTWPNATASLAPLGYRPHTTNPDDKDIVPIYSPGLPMIMAVFKRVGGARAVYLVVPLLGALAVFATYLMGVRLAGPMVGASAAILLAASPTFLFEIVSPTSDIPSTAWWALGLALLMIDRRWTAFAAGMSMGLAILTRPNVVPLAAVPAVMLVWRAARARFAGSGGAVTSDVRLKPDATGARPDVTGVKPDATVRMLLFAAGSIPACIAVALINRTLYGSPLATGYGPFDSLYSWAFLKTNLAHYPRWIIETETILVLLALAAPFVLKPDPSAPTRAARPRAVAIMWLSFVGVTFLLYLFYLPFEEWWYVRFIMPAYPAILVLTCAVLWMLAAPAERLLAGAQGLVAATAVAAIAWHGVSFSLERGAQLQWIAEQRYATVGKYIGSTLPERVVIICMQHSGGARYYSGRITVRYDWIAPTDLDLVVNQLRQLGYVPYLLLDDWEEPQFRQRFAGYSALAALDWAPIARLHEDHVRVYETLDRRSQPSDIQSHK